MMIWLMALQARRDQFALAEKSLSTNDLDLDPDSGAAHQLDPGGPRERSSSDLSMVRVMGNRQAGLLSPSAYQHRPLESTRSLQDGQANNVSFLGRSPEWRREQLRRMGQTVDHGTSPALKKDAGHRPLLASTRQLSLSTEKAQVLPRAHQDMLWPPGGAAAGLDSCGGVARVSLTGAGGIPFSSGSATSISTDTSEELWPPSEASQHRVLVRTASLKSGAPDVRGKALVRSETIAARPEAGGGDHERVTDLEKELIATKCELAKVLNRQTTFQEILMQKDEIIEDLDEKLGKKSPASDVYDSKKRASTMSRQHQERVRVLQNQNRFLNEEVRRLAKLRGQEFDKIRHQDCKVRSLEADIELWKLEYISLIQSSIRFTGADTMDDAELSLFGGDRHKHRILSLLEDARKINPSLPTYEHLASGEVHVDYFGFKHEFQDDGLLLHYLCQELSQHFLTQASAYEKHQKRWQAYIKHHGKCLTTSRKELKALVRAGVPDQHRRAMWRLFVMSQVEEIMLDKGAHYYRSLCSAVPDSPLAGRYKKQISLDLMRTMPSNIKFSTPGSKGSMDLQDVLLAFCIHNPTVGYCQGMNFLVAMALLFMDAQDAFWLLVAVTERYHSPSYFDHNLLGAQADQNVLQDLMAEKMPDLAKHLDAIDIEISTVTLNWFLALFFDAVPFQTLLRVWDVFLLEGPKVLFRFSLAILHIHAKEIIRKCDTISVMRHLKSCARISYDVDGLVQVAFKTLKPFARRQDIVSKQTFYLNSLKEKYRFRELQRLACQERENAFLSIDTDPESCIGFECCTITRPGEAWVCYGVPPSTRVCVVDCQLETMTDTDILFDTRVMSMTAVTEELVFFGTLAWYIYAFRQDTREMLWQQRVHDAVLSLEVYQEDAEDNSFRLFAALADGTVAVFETIKPTSSDTSELLYLPIGQSQVTCLQLLGNQLWCACGNTVSIIHARTLDPMDRFTVSSNPYDSVLTLKPALSGVWLSVRGSSVLELWDPSTLACKMLYDTRTGRYPNLRKEDDSYFNAARITSILALDYSVWVGTGEGTLITFDVFQQASTSATDSPAFPRDSADTQEGAQSWLQLTHKGDADSYNRLLEVEKRVKDLYASQRLAGENTGGKEGRTPQGNGGGAAPSPGLASTGKGDNEEGYGSGNSRNSTKASGKAQSPLTSEKKDSKSPAKTASCSPPKPSALKITNGTNVEDEQDSSCKSSVLVNKNIPSMREATESTSQNDSGYSKTGSVSSPTFLMKTDPMATIVGSDNSSENSKSHQDINAQETPSVYYLFRPDLDNSTTTPKKGDEKNREVTKSSLPPKSTDSLATVKVTNRAKKPGDNGLASDHFPSDDKATDESALLECCVNAKSQFYTNSEESRQTCEDQHSTGIITNSTSTCSPDSQNDENIQSEVEAKRVCAQETQKNTTFVQKDLSNQPGENQSSNNYKAECGCSRHNVHCGKEHDQNGNALPKDTCHPEEQILITNNMVNSKHSAESDCIQHIPRLSNGHTIEANGRSLSEESNKTTGSDDVFCAPICTDIVSSNPLQMNGVHSQDFDESTKCFHPPTVPSELSCNGHLAATDSPDEADISMTITRGPDEADLSMTITPGPEGADSLETITNGSDGVDLPESITPTPETDYADLDRVPCGLPLSVRTLAAKFESNSIDTVTEKEERLKNGFNKSVIAGEQEDLLNADAPERQSRAEMRNGTARKGSAGRPTSLVLSANGHPPLRRVSSFKEIILTATELSLQNDPVNSAPDGCSREREGGSAKKGIRVMKAGMQHRKSEPKLGTGRLVIDTTYYGESDEESSVHEARVQSFKNTYRKLSPATAALKYKGQGGSIPETELKGGHQVVCEPTSRGDSGHKSSTATHNAHNAAVSQLKHVDSGPENTNSIIYDPISVVEKKVNCTLENGKATLISASQTSNTATIQDKDCQNLNNAKDRPTAVLTNDNRGPSRVSSVSKIVKKKSHPEVVERPDSELSSVRDFRPAAPEARWRLDYTNIHVETDMESLALSSVSNETSDTTGDSDNLHRPRPTSATGTASDDTSSEVTDERLTQFLKDTAISLATSYGHSPGESTDFQTTPTTASGCNSASWSSYDELSTPTQDSDRSVRPARPPTMTMDSRSTSIASTVELYYGADLTLLSKNKIADKIVKCLLTTQCKSKPVVLSFSGSHKDDEAVLLWSREANETLWTNSPIFEYNATTQTPVLPRYMRPHMPSSSSNTSSPKQRQASTASQ